MLYLYVNSLPDNKPSGSKYVEDNLIQIWI